jgi:hypothetical protein
VSLPVAFELIRKPTLYSDLTTKKVKRKSEKTKNDILRQMLGTCRQSQLKYHYVLADSWFSAQENLTFWNFKCFKLIALEEIGQFE